MTLAIAFAHVWGVIQLIILGSLTRTVRVRTVLAALAVGLYAIGPLTILLELVWIHLAASLTGTPVAHMTSIASYSLDPFIEEALKLLPLAMLLLLIPTVRRQWSVTDCVLIAAATGSGYGLAENLYRYAGSPHAAHAIAGGWAISIGNVTLLVPGIVRTLTSWLPAGTVSVDETIRVNSHLVWSAIGGLAVGLLLRYRTRTVRMIAGGLFLYIALDHATGNAALHRDTWLGHVAPALHALATLGGLLVFVALAVAWWLDRTAPHTGDALEPLLAAERAESSRFAGTVKAAMSRLPWSMYWVSGFARTRRAYHAAHAAAPGRPDGLLAAVVAQRDRVDRELTQTESPSLLPSGLTPTALRNVLGRPAVILALVCGAPSILYLVIGGFPQTAGIQTVMKGPVVWPLVLLVTAFAQARLAWSVIVGVRNWSKTRRLPSGDDAAIVGLQLACGIGAVGLAGFAMVRVFSGVSAGSSLLSSANGADAANRVSPEDAAAVANTAAAAGEAAADAAEPDGYGTDEGDVANPVIHAETGGAASLGSEADAGMDVDAESDAPAEAEAAAAEAEARAAQAEADAAQANADALEAQKFHKQAVDVVDSAEIRQSTDGFDDPWDGRKADEMEEAKRAVGVAADGVTEANAQAAEARAAADTAREAANNARIAADRAADPLGTAASDAEKNYADAKAREGEAFYDTHQDFAAAQKAAALAREQAEAARAAADAAKDPRTAQVTPWDKP